MLPDTLDGFIARRQFKLRPADAPELNLTLLDEHLDWLRAHPDQHRQDVWMSMWSCGSAHCLAGNVAACTMPPGSTVHWQAPNRWVATKLPPGTMIADLFTTPDGYDVRIEEWAIEQLGLLRDEAGVLFDESNSIADMTRMRDVLALGYTFDETDWPSEYDEDDEE